MAAVLTVLAIWLDSPEMLNEQGQVLSAWTTSSLLAAINKSRSDIVSVLLSVTEKGEFPVQQALAVGSVNNLEAFMWNGWDVNELVGMEEPSALSMLSTCTTGIACIDLRAPRYAFGNDDVVKWLLEHDADPNAGYEYDTPLSRAALWSKVEILKLLLSYGGDVKRGDVLHWAVERDDNTCEILILLLDHGTQLDRLRFDSREPRWSVFGVKELGTPMHMAVARGKTDMISLLLQRGTDKNIKDTHGRTVVQLAVELGDPEMISILERS